MTDVNFPAITLCEDHGSDTGEYVRSVFNYLKFPDKELNYGKELYEEFQGILNDFTTDYPRSEKITKILPEKQSGWLEPYFVYMNDTKSDYQTGLVLYVVEEWFENIPEPNCGMCDIKIRADLRDISADFGTFVDRVGRLSEKGVGKKVCMICTLMVPMSLPKC